MWLPVAFGASRWRRGGARRRGCGPALAGPEAADMEGMQRRQGAGLGDGALGELRLVPRGEAVLLSAGSGPARGC